MKVLRMKNTSSEAEEEHDTSCDWFRKEVEADSLIDINLADILPLDIN